MNTQQSLKQDYTFHGTSPGRSVTRTRRQYVSSLANSVKATRNTGQCIRPLVTINAPATGSRVLAWDLCDTRATSLRKQN